MGSIISNFPALDAIRLKDVPTKPFTPQKVVRNGDSVFIMDAHNEVYICRAYKAGGWAFPVKFSAWQWQSDLLEALVRLGKVPRKLANEYQAKVREREAARAKEWDAQTAAEYLDKLGIKKPAALVSMLKKDKK